MGWIHAYFQLHKVGGKKWSPFGQGTMLHTHSHGLDQYWKLLFTLSLKLQDHEGWMVLEVAWLARAMGTLGDQYCVIYQLE